MDNMHMELINFLIERYYLSLPLLIVIFLLIYSSSTKGGKKISPQFLISLANNENAFIVDLRNSELFNQGHITDSIKRMILDKNLFIGHKFNGIYLDCGSMDGYINSGIKISKL